MPTTVNKRLILSGAPFGWLHELATGAPGTITSLWRFDNLQSAQIKALIPGDQQSGENIDINRADGAIWRFSKYNLVLSGEDETDITPASASSDATGKGEITLVTNEAPLPTTINSWTAWLESLKGKFNSLFMLTVPTGFTLHSRDTQKKVDGYAHMLCKLSTGIDLQLNNNPGSLSLTFVSYKNSLAGLTGTIIEAATFTGIVHKGKGDSYAPEALEVGDGDLLLAGNILFKESASYTYS
jgi:hypothetical protein